MPKPKATALPGMEDSAIDALEEVGAEYAEIRDERMHMNEREAALKHHALVLMKKHGKTIYRRNGIEITLIPGEDDIKVRVKKPETDDETAAQPETSAPEPGHEFDEQRRGALAQED